MKKLILTLTISCVTCLINAAAVDWSAGGIVDPVATATAGKNTPANGWLGYMILASDVSTVTSNLGKGDFSSLTSKAVGPTKTTTSKGQFATSSATGSVASGDQTFYLVVLNANTTDAATAYFISAGNTVSVDSSLDTMVSFGSQINYTKDASSWVAIPEPTSGLLMLFGMAGLALRRKQTC